MILCKENISQIIEALRECGGRIYCFGAGNMGRDLFDIFEAKHMNVERFIFVDNNSKLHDTVKVIDGYHLPVISSAEMIRKIEKEDILIIATLACREIFDSLEAESKLEHIKCYFAQLLFDKELKEVTYEKKISNIEEIPKIIHYCWFGGNEIPEELQHYIDGWKRLCPDYTIVRWDESNYDISKHLYAYEAYQEKKWGFVPDPIRLDIIYEHGGIYLDTDVELLKRPDELLVEEAFFSFSAMMKVNTGNGFGAKKNHPIIKLMLEEYEGIHFKNLDGTCNEDTCAVYQYQALKKARIRNVDNFAILPLEVLGAYNHYLDEYRFSEQTVAVHHYKRSWQDEEKKRWNSEMVPFLQRMVTG